MNNDSKTSNSFPENLVMMFLGSAITLFGLFLWNRKKIKSLEKQLDDAIENEEWGKVDKINTKIIERDAVNKPSIKELTILMNKAAAEDDFEKAAYYRDQINMLISVKEKNK